jgi:hypothetical protein
MTMHAITNVGICMTAIFILAFSALAALNILLLFTVFSDVLKLWPTPSKHSWQTYVFWPLFRSGLGLTILLGVISFAATPHYDLQAAFGVPLALAGLGLPSTAISTWASITPMARMTGW